MKRKARIQTGIDDRLVAIYARKSRITNKGDSIGVQFKQSADYAINQLSLPEDYEFARYEDKGLSGYYSDRPDFQRLLRDIEMGKIKAVACYKLDRISRKTSDLMRLLEYFERHDVTLLVCSNNINTRISTSKIIIQVLAIIAEFERDILTERIQDNLMELAKDGRWLGGKTPTGFSSQRVTTGSGKNKSAISFLVPVQEEKEIVLEIYGTFWETRSLLQTANIINEKYETKHGAKFTTSAIRLILRNPIYCVADEYSYNYFLEHDGNLFGEPSDFDGQHGLTAYNKTDQMKVEDEDSTFFNPKFSQLLTRKPISEWIVSVGRHEGFISSRKWVETQNMLDEIAEKYNRPHRKTNALLSGLMYCPICGKRLRVLPESNRWTNGKPRFKYACPGVRAKECTFKGVEGVTLDEFVIHSLSSLQEEHSDYYRQLLENRVASMIRTDQSEKEYQETKKAIERLNADIAAQVRNLREADDALKRFIQDDIKELTDELAKREAALRRMEDTQSENQYLIHELNGMKKRLLSFEEFAKGAQPEALFTLVHSIVDRIYITTDGTKQKCQVYIKGCATEDYSDVLGAAGYIEEEPLLPVASYVPPMCDLDYYSIVYNTALPFIDDYDTYAGLHMAHITSSAFMPERIKNANQLLASEGAVASIFYHIYINDVFKNRYSDKAFYSSFGMDRDSVDPVQNLYLKILYVMTRLDMSKPTLLTDFIKAYGDNFPDEKKELYSLFVRLTYFSTVSGDARHVFERLYSIGRNGEVEPFRTALRESSELKTRLIEQLLSGEVSLEAAVRPDIWIDGDEYIAPTPWNPEIKVRYKFCANSATAVDFLSMSGMTVKRAEQLIMQREQLGGFKSVEEFYELLERI